MIRGCIPPPARGKHLCTVVGSADTQYNLGRNIDASDVVIRINDAPTRGFERVVGSKTTHRIVNWVSVRVWAGMQTVKLSELRYPYQKNAFDPSVCYNVTCVLGDADENMYRLLRLARERHTALKIQLMPSLVRRSVSSCMGGVPSAGRKAVMFALHLPSCRRPVRIINFAPDCCGKTVSYKYYHNNASAWVCCSSGREPMSDEYHLYQKLSHTGLTELVWSPPYLMHRVPTLVETNGGLFTACESPQRRICAFRKNSKERTIVVLTNGTQVRKVQDADDPRIFFHSGGYYMMNNNFYRLSILLLPYGREILLPFYRAKNMIPYSYNGKLHLLDLQKKLLWKGTLTPSHVELKTQVKVDITIHSSVDDGCHLEKCHLRAGTPGLITGNAVTGVGHCTSKSLPLRHIPFWWRIENMKKWNKKIVHTWPICNMDNALVDPSALFLDQGDFVLLATEASEEWNHKSTKYFNSMFRFSPGAPIM